MSTQSQRNWRGRGAKRERTRTLRTAQTDAEVLLWQQLRNRQLDGEKFRRQHVLCGYIVDFLCVKHSLVVELDGAVHDNRIEQDSERTRILETAGYRVIRFTNDDVEENFATVLRRISEHFR